MKKENEVGFAQGNCKGKSDNCKNKYSLECQKRIKRIQMTEECIIRFFEAIFRETKG